LEEESEEEVEESEEEEEVDGAVNELRLAEEDADVTRFKIASRVWVSVTKFEEGDTLVGVEGVEEIGAEEKEDEKGEEDIDVEEDTGGLLKDEVKGAI
jgi:hypothetical protein